MQVRWLKPNKNRTFVRSGHCSYFVPGDNFSENQLLTKSNHQRSTNEERSLEKSKSIGTNWLELVDASLFNRSNWIKCFFDSSYLCRLCRAKYFLKSQHDIFVLCHRVQRPDVCYGNKRNQITENWQFCHLTSLIFDKYGSHESGSWELNPLNS